MMDTDEQDAPAQPQALNNVQLGERLGVSSSYASYLRSGERLPGPETQQRIVAEFGVSFEELNAAIVAARVHKRFEPIRELMVSVAGEQPPSPPERDWGARIVKCDECGVRPKQPCKTRGGHELPFGDEHKARKDRAAARLTGSQATG